MSCVLRSIGRLASSKMTKGVSAKAWSGKCNNKLDAFAASVICSPSSRSCMTISPQELPCPLDIDNRDLLRLVDMYDTFLLDCDGVLWGNDHYTKFRNTRQTIEKLRRLGKQLIFVTNNSMHTRETCLQKFITLGNFEARVEDVFSVNYAAALYLKSIAKVQGKVYAIGSKGMTEELNNMGIRNFGFGMDQDPISDFKEDLLQQEIDPEVQAVLVGFDIHIGFNKIFKAASYLSRDDTLYVTTNDVETRVPIASNRVLPLSGALMEAVNAASGRKPIVIGKPHSHLLACVLAANPMIDLRRTVMIGDSITTDVSFANNSGIDSILVFSGTTSPEDLQKYHRVREFMPTYTLSAFSRFAEVL